MKKNLNDYVFHQRKSKRMYVSIIFNYLEIGYEVWVTDTVAIGDGMGSVFDNKADALKYASDHSTQLLDLSESVMPLVGGEILRNFLSEYLEMTEFGGILSIKEKGYYQADSNTA